MIPRVDQREPTLSLKLISTLQILTLLVENAVMKPVEQNQLHPGERAGAMLRYGSRLLKDSLSMSQHLVRMKL